MKSTGIVRRIDELGRVVLPKELRRLFDLKSKDSVEIFTEGSHIILKKYQPECIFCGDADNIFTIKGRNVCKNCLKEISSSKRR